MVFGDIIRQSELVDNSTGSAGGDGTTVYGIGNSDIYSLNESDLTQSGIKSLDDFTNEPLSVGGTKDVIWGNSNGGGGFGLNLLREYSPSDFSVIRETSDFDPFKVGGGDNVIWVSEGEIKEVSPSDFSQISSGGSDGPVGIGGNESVIWTIEQFEKDGSTVEALRERDPSDFSVLSSTTNIEDRAISDVGGYEDQIWAGKGDYVYELATPVEIPSAPSNLSVTH